MSKACWRMSLMLLMTLVLCEAGVARSLSATATGAGSRRNFGTITGSVRDSHGNPLAGALVTLLRDGADEIVKQTKSATDGTFTARVAPGRYLLRAVAEGFNAVTFSAVQVNSSAELVYRFNLEPAGQGRTVPERRRDRDDRKWDIRAAQNHRSIFQIDEGENEAIGAAATDGMSAEAEVASTDSEEANAEGASSDQTSRRRARAQGVVETFFTASANELQPGPQAGINFAVATPVNEQLDFVFAGQLGAFERLETTARMRLGSRHNVSATVGGVRMPIRNDTAGTVEDALGQISMRAVDEWVVRDGVVVVLGLDYSRFVGASGADSLSPRLGVQFDANARTRVKAAYAPGNNSSRAQSVAQFENGPVIFREQLDQPIALIDGQAVMEQSRRLEFGIERVLDERSSVEATAFFDTTAGRGIGLLSTPLNAFANENGAALISIANQQGAARGMRVVYMRRLSRFLKTSAGYSFGRGQRLAPSEDQTTPENIFRDGYFQTAAAQIDADVFEGTRVRTVLRFSPRAAVFAIDPFAGQLAVYDPSLSILVTQELPSFGLPVRAEAVLDARNLLDVMTSTEDAETFISIGAMRRMVRGGISVRF